MSENQRMGYPENGRIDALERELAKTEGERAQAVAIMQERGGTIERLRAALLEIEKWNPRTCLSQPHLIARRALGDWKRRSHG